MNGTQTDSTLQRLAMTAMIAISMLLCLPAGPAGEPEAGVSGPDPIAELPVIPEDPAHSSSRTPSPSAGGDWWDQDWKYRMKLTFNASAVKRVGFST